MERGLPWDRAAMAGRFPLVSGAPEADRSISKGVNTPVPLTIFIEITDYEPRQLPGTQLRITGYRL